MGILYTSFLYTHNDGTRGTTKTTKDCHMYIIRGNHNQAWKYFDKPTQRKCSHENFYGKMTYYAQYLSTLGSIGVVRIIATIKSKV